ncbi:hypothetical protein RFI_09484 [Reticulomyxa filosa]|uniref:Uncharacterized protein n=1 Tax=Reticulomyxa filosa TaxID=46433 RepID=X6NPM4_RETFI|nr:hypothetical protein RFI_09484 [Reticulomyxa filosa]|eukprot:ETO27649.1 hypothetical protein RFI_09484 [Reticulomyxa filosa]
MFKKTKNDNTKVINEIYKEQERFCAQRFQTFDFQTFMEHQYKNTIDTSEKQEREENKINIELLNNHKERLTLFQHALRSVYPHFEAAQMSVHITLEENCNVASNQDMTYFSKFYSFCELLRDVHLLRDLTIQTFKVLTVLITEMKKMAGDLDQVSAFEQQFRRLSTSLLCSHNLCAPQQKAFVLSDEAFFEPFFVPWFLKFF